MFLKIDWLVKFDHKDVCIRKRVKLHHAGRMCIKNVYSNTKRRVLDYAFESLETMRIINIHRLSTVIIII